MVDIAKAQALMTDPNFWNNVNATEKMKNHGKKSVGYEQDMGPSNNTVMYEQAAYQQNRTTQPRFSKELMESFAEMPPVECDSGLMSELPDSFLAGASQSMANMGGLPVDMTPRQQVTNQRMGQPRSVNEAVQYPTSMPQQMPMSSTVDYNYIKYLVTEAVKECMKPMLNEGQNGGNAFRGMIMKGGNKIQFLDKQGNLYEAELKLKKRAE